MPLSEAKALLAELQADAKQISTLPNSHESGNRAGTSSRGFHESDCLHIFEHDPLSDRAALETLACSCEIFSPYVGMEMAEQPESLLAEVTNVSHLFGGEYQLAVQAKKHCQQRGYLAVAAVADTIGQAWGFSHFGHVVEVTRLRAKAKQTPTSLNSRESGCGTNDTGKTTWKATKPMIVEPGCAGLCRHLPIEALRLLPATTGVLHELGIDRIEQLWRLSRAELAARFGNEITDQLDKLTGHREETFAGCQSPPEFYVESCFDYPTDNRSSIEATFARLIRQLCRQMHRRQQGALQWTFRLVCDSLSVAQFHVGLFSPTAIPNEVIPLMQMQLEQKTFSEMGMVHEVSVSVVQSALMEEKQKELFATETRSNKRALNHLINRLSSRLGHENVVKPRLTSSKLPEDAFFLQPLVGMHVSATRTSKSNRNAKRHQSQRNGSRKHISHQADPFDRPFRLYRSPIELSAVDAANPGSPLAMFCLRGKSYQVKHTWGPERIETRWWTGPTIRRDYFRIEIESGAQFWVYRDLRNRKWFLHGEFS